MHINAVIKNFKPYNIYFERKNLQLFTLDQVLNDNILSKNSFLIQIGTSVYAVSKWTGPKRTRTYPYQHVYDTMSHKPRVTLIPCVKDEGKGGDRDYLQWDTVSLMNLLGVHVILTYHVSARRSSLRGAEGKQKITGHQIDKSYIYERLQELASYQHDHVHWNRREIETMLPVVLERTVQSYEQISVETGVELKNVTQIRERIHQLKTFQEESRRRAVSAQQRETLINHANERAGEGLKSTITITNFYDGSYYFTVDEAMISGEKLFLIEKKHGRGIMPSTADIKDGLLKLILYHNLEVAEVEGLNYIPRAVLGLTSDKLNGYIHSKMTVAQRDLFFTMNPTLSTRNRAKLQSLLDEASQNGVLIYLVNADEEETYKHAILNS